MCVIVVMVLCAVLITKNFWVSIHKDVFNTSKEHTVYEGVVKGTLRQGIIVMKVLLLRVQLIVI